MAENDFVTLMRDIGLNVRQTAGTVPNLAARLTDNNVSNTVSTDTPSQPSQIFLPNQPHVYINSRRPLSAVNCCVMKKLRQS